MFGLCVQRALRKTITDFFFFFYSWSSEAEQAADRYRHQLGGRTPPRQEVWGLWFLLRQRHRPGHPRVAQVSWASLLPHFLYMTAYGALCVAHTVTHLFFPCQTGNRSLPWFLSLCLIKMAVSALLAPSPFITRIFAAWLHFGHNWLIDHMRINLVVVESHNIFTLMLSCLNGINRCLHEHLDLDSSCRMIKRFTLQLLTSMYHPVACVWFSLSYPGDLESLCGCHEPSPLLCLGTTRECYT